MQRITDLILAWFIENVLRIEVLDEQPVYTTTATTIGGWSIEIKEGWLRKYYREMTERARR